MRHSSMNFSQNGTLDGHTYALATAMCEIPAHWAARRRPLRCTYNGRVQCGS